MDRIINTDNGATYTAPSVEILEIEVETGIAMSPGDLGDGGDVQPYY